MGAMPKHFSNLNCGWHVVFYIVGEKVWACKMGQYNSAEAILSSWEKNGWMHFLVLVWWFNKWFETFFYKNHCTPLWFKVKYFLLGLQLFKIIRLPAKENWRCKWIIEIIYKLSLQTDALRMCQNYNFRMSYFWPYWFVIW